tara:strand:- start:545 stop:1150 length:606 start_codon:yes stop_codon:yes gene_type:complete
MRVFYFKTMAENKKTFVFYSDWSNMINEMPNNDAGELLKHILSYVNDENPTTENVLVRMAFGHMKPLLKTDLIKWEGIRQKRSEYGKKGGQAKAKQKLAKAKQVEAVNGNVNVNVINKENNNFILEDLKIEFCDIYPKAGNPFTILSALQSLPKNEQTKAVEYVPTYVKNTEKTYYKTPVNYLNSYCWNDKDNIKTKITYE